MAAQAKIASFLRKEVSLKQREALSHSVKCVVGEEDGKIFKDNCNHILVKSPALSPMSE